MRKKSKLRVYMCVICHNIINSIIIIMSVTDRVKSDPLLSKENLSGCQRKLKKFWT